MDDIGIIILAAGRSQRFYSDKRLAPFNDQYTLLEATLAKIPSSFTKRLLVLRADDQVLAEKFNATWDICLAEDSKQGMGASLANGMAEINAWQGAIIGLGDMPLIKTETYQALQQALTEHPIVYPVHNGKRGNPVGFSARYFTELSQLNNDNGARHILTKYFEDCHQLPCTDNGIFTDIDTMDELKFTANQ